MDHQYKIIVEKRDKIYNQNNNFDDDDEKDDDQDELQDEIENREFIEGIKSDMIKYLQTKCQEINRFNKKNRIYNSLTLNVIK